MTRNIPATVPFVNADSPTISLVGEVNETMARHLRDKLAEQKECRDNPLSIEITTLGGDAEMVRRMVKDIDDARDRLKPRRLLFLGKTMVYSAGVTLMAAFPRADRYLTKDAMLLIHGRQLDQTVHLTGPLRGSLPKVEAIVHQLKAGISLEIENFERLVDGSDVSMDELCEKALYNWYLSAEEALDRGLIAWIV